MTTAQVGSLRDLFEEVLRALSLSDAEMGEIIKSRDILKKQVKPILQKLAMEDQRFGPAVMEFEFAVPDSYNHDTQIDTFAKKTKKRSDTYYFNNNLTSKNFAKATTRLIPGKTYRVRIFPILDVVSGEDCLIFLAKRNAILVGAQGLTLLQEVKKEKVSSEESIISFDQKDSLWADLNGEHCLPYMYCGTTGGWVFSIGSFERDRHLDNYLLCVNEL